MADQTEDPHDDKVRTVPLPTDDGTGERVIAQENQSPEVAMGGGEWPSTDAPPTGPAPGTGDESTERGARRPGDTIEGPPPGSATNPTLQQDGRSAGDRGPARIGDTGLPGDDEDGDFPPVKDVLEADPVAAGSRSVPQDDDRQDTGETRFS
jgi:hypothetical protein